jgi:hypothetical protein
MSPVLQYGSELHSKRERGKEERKEERKEEDSVNQTMKKCREIQSY